MMPGFWNFGKHEKGRKKNLSDELPEQKVPVLETSQIIADWHANPVRQRLFRDRNSEASSSFGSGSSCSSESRSSSAFEDRLSKRSQFEQNRSANGLFSRSHDDGQSTSFGGGTSEIVDHGKRKHFSSDSSLGCEFKRPTSPKHKSSEGSRSKPEQATGDSSSREYKSDCVPKLRLCRDDSPVPKQGSKSESGTSKKSDSRVSRYKVKIWHPPKPKKETSTSGEKTSGRYENKLNSFARAKSGSTTSSSSSGKHGSGSSTEPASKSSGSSLGSASKLETGRESDESWISKYKYKLWKSSSRTVNESGLFLNSGHETFGNLGFEAGSSTSSRIDPFGTIQPGNGSSSNTTAEFGSGSSTSSDAKSSKSKNNGKGLETATGRVNEQPANSPPLWRPWEGPSTSGVVSQAQRLRRGSCARSSSSDSD